VELGPDRRIPLPSGHQTRLSSLCVPSTDFKVELIVNLESGRVHHHPTTMASVHAQTSQSAGLSLRTPAMPANNQTMNDKQGTPGLVNSARPTNQTPTHSPIAKPKNKPFESLHDFRNGTTPTTNPMGVVAKNCEVGKGGRGWSEARVNPRGFLRKLSLKFRKFSGRLLRLFETGILSRKTGV